MSSSKQLTRLNEELTKAMQSWTDLVAAIKAVKWPPVGELTDVADSSNAWQDINSQIDALREQSRQVEHAAKCIDDEIDKLNGRLLNGEPDVVSDDALVVFLSAAVPERRYELIYECQKLATLTERIRAEGGVQPSVHWKAQLEKILHHAERGFHGCEWQLDEITKTLQADRKADEPTLGTEAAGSRDKAPSAPEHEAHPEHHEHQHEHQHEPHPEVHEARAEQEAGEAQLETLTVEGEARLQEVEPSPLEEEPAELPGAAAAVEAVDDLPEMVTASVSGDSDARVEEDVLDGM